MLSPHITYSHKFNQSGVDLTNLYKLCNAHQDARKGVMVVRVYNAKYCSLTYLHARSRILIGLISMETI